MKIALAGQGAFGTRHLEAIQNIPDVEVVSLSTTEDTIAIGLHVRE